MEGWKIQGGTVATGDGMQWRAMGCNGVQWGTIACFFSGVVGIVVGIAKKVVGIFPADLSTKFSRLVLFARR